MIPPPPSLSAALLPAPALRAALEQAVIADLLGPAGGAEEEVDETRVSDRYLVGLLAPRKRRLEPEEFDDLGVERSPSPEDGAADRGALPAPTLSPSSMGLSFTVAGGTAALKVMVRWGRYQRVVSERVVDDAGKPKRTWKRTQVEGVLAAVPLRPGLIGPLVPVPEHPEVGLQGLVRPLGGDLIVTLFLVNGQEEKSKNKDEAWLFQPEIAVEAPGGAAVFLHRPTGAEASRLDPESRAEARAMAMLYRDEAEFAVGHGVSVHAERSPDDPDRAVRVRTAVVPIHEVPQQTPPSAADFPALDGLVLDMKELAEASQADLPGKLSALPRAYEAWIRDAAARAARDPRLLPHAEAAAEALARCEVALGRIREGLDLLARDARAAEAFRFANRAMGLQRVHTLLAEAARRGSPVTLEEVDVPQNRTWYAFQLAFVLLNLAGATDLAHPDRTHATDAIADLLWFPTGGGKTEAYLGLAAYVMGLRRLQGTVEGRSGEHGVAVLMRYTLRLLTLQQFQRASALICACETIRRDALAAGDASWGREPFRIGLWVGQKTTPNKTKQAHEALRQGRGTRDGAFRALGFGSPAQLTSCPWCGAEIKAGVHIQVQSYEQGAGRTLTFCGDPLGRCPFSAAQAPGEGLPVLVVDEEIYRRLPTLLIATVDKFAQLPWNGLTQMLFGQVDSVCPRHGFRSSDLEDADSHPRKGDLPPVRSVPVAPLRPPDLIIQDELHLISGPLGSLTGLYETAVDELCSWTVAGKRVRPKVVASTATIRRASQQVHALFLRRVSVFPPHGLEVGDNFFSLRRDPTERPGRRYLGICAPGRRLKAAMIRVYVAFLGAAQQLYERHGQAADPWMTLVGYFNAMRELAGMRRLTEDDVRTRLRDADRRGLARRTGLRLEELTSRKASTDIPRLLDRLEKRFDPSEDVEREAARKAHRRWEGANPLDVLLATNMVSVGVDVKRLGLMVVCGQPKTTAEYIQATSRVGRSFPGLVATVCNWARPRDLSHYERFENYHARFYEHVEALSLTPFAPRAVDRGLTALLVSLVRLPERTFNGNERAEVIDPTHPLVARAIERIVERAGAVTASQETADAVRAMLKARLDAWVHEARREAGAHLGYKERKDGRTRGLLRPAGFGPWEPFTCLNSLRDVEPTVGLIFSDPGSDDEPGMGPPPGVNAPAGGAP